VSPPPAGASSSSTRDSTGPKSRPRCRRECDVVRNPDVQSPDLSAPRDGCPPGPKPSRDGAPALTPACAGTPAKLPDQSCP